MAGWGIEKGVIHDSLALLMIQSKTVAKRERARESVYALMPQAMFMMT